MEKFQFRPAVPLEPDGSWDGIVDGIADGYKLGSRDGISDGDDDSNRDGVEEGGAVRNSIWMPSSSLVTYATFPALVATHTIRPATGACSRIEGLMGFPNKK